MSVVKYVDMHTYAKYNQNIFKKYLHFQSKPLMNI